MRGIDMLRRAILLSAPAAILVACTTTKNGGGSTTYSIDTHKVDIEGTAILQALGAMLAAPSIAMLLGPNYVSAQAAVAAAQAALASFDELTGGTMSTTYDPAKAQALILSLISDAQQVLMLVQQITPKISAGSVATAIGNYVAAVQALLVFLQASIGLALAGATIKPRLTEDQALHIATH
jgi:hypothetical protein